MATTSMDQSGRKPFSCHRNDPYPNQRKFREGKSSKSRPKTQLKSHRNQMTSLAATTRMSTFPRSWVLTLSRWRSNPHNLMSWVSPSNLKRNLRKRGLFRLGLTYYKSPNNNTINKAFLWVVAVSTQNSISLNNSSRRKVCLNRLCVNDKIIKKPIKLTLCTFAYTGAPSHTRSPWQHPNS